jgi:hypothetical protein
MAELSPITNYNVAYAFADQSLAGRVPPGYTPPNVPLSFLQKQYQLRPNLVNPRKLIENRKYSDNPIQPYVSTYDLFTIPLIFELDPLEIAAGAEGFTKITGRLVECTLESPLAVDGKNKTKVSVENGNIKVESAGLTLKDSGKAIWKAGAFQEPFIYGPALPDGTSFPRMDDPRGVSIGEEFVPGGLGPIATYTFGGYFTERNFFDREWITSWGPFNFKVDCFGAYVQNPVSTLSPIEISDLEWIRVRSWTPDQFYQENITLANKFDANVVQQFIQGATSIVNAKQSEIGSLRFYFQFTVKTDAPSLPAETIYATLTVKYNQDVGTERLKWALKRQNPDQQDPPVSVDFQLE